MKAIVLSVVAAIFILTSCAKTASNPVSSTDCSGGTKSFSKDVLPIISSNCSSCHYQFTSYYGIAGSASSIKSRILDGSMPKGSSLTTAQKNIVACWVDNGATNN